MYAGYELYEHIPFKDGGEEYRDSEKYEIKVRDWQGARKAVDDYFDGLGQRPYMHTIDYSGRVFIKTASHQVPKGGKSA